jgi:DNA-binding NarL/FixJ family response regulator
VVIADDHAVVREGTRRILEQEPDIMVVADVGDGEEAVRAAGALQPDVVLMDISMPKIDGVEATRRIKAEHPRIAILVLTAYDDDQFVFGLLEAGAAGYLLKSIRGQELVDAVRAVYAGESVLHPTVARKVLNRFVAPPLGRESRGQSDIISGREMDILRLAASGLGNKDIADRLCISVRTVQGHLGHIFNKLQVGSRTEAVVRALREGWVTLDELSRPAAGKEK